MRPNDFEIKERVGKGSFGQVAFYLMIRYLLADL
jgi:hypothetical protein